MCDKYYDSLDEEEEEESILPPRKSASESSDISQMVPLYNRETAASEIISSKIRASGMHSCTRLTLSKNESNSTSSGSLNHFFLDSNKKKSYIDLFHAKIGYVQGSEPTDTTRGICEDNFKTARTSAGSLDNSDAESAVSFVSDDSSFYIKFLENEKAEANKLSSVSCRSTMSTASSLTLGNLTRSTQNVSISVRSNAQGKTVTNKGKFDKSALRVPTLGGLGPDRESCKEKLEKLKRKQRYGQKVSNENRMKMMETKVMKNFKYELKKSSDLNKCADSVLIS